MSILQCMQFHSSYDEESYNEHEFMYHDFYTIEQMKICVNDHNTFWACVNTSLHILHMSFMHYYHKMKHVYIVNIYISIYTPP